MRRDERAVLFEREALSPQAFLLHFRSEELYRSFAPGQFTMVRLPASMGLLLRRPYSFCDAEASRSSFSLLVKEAGAGTRALARLPLGTAVDCLGPLGSSFRMPEAGETPLIVAGGVGIAPFVAFCRALASAGHRAVVLLGGRKAEDLYLRETFGSIGMDVRCATEDGSFGTKGLVTAILEELLDEGGADYRVYSCGPTPMLLRVAEIASRHGLPHQVSLERRMGCGMGCCLGCVVYDRAAQEYVRCCTEGPVYDASDVDWERDPYPL